MGKSSRFFGLAFAVVLLMLVVPTAALAAPPSGFVQWGTSTGLPFVATASGDFNEDHVLDVAACDSTGGVSLWFGDGTGAFTSSYTVATGGFLFDIAAADIDGDGHLDVVTIDRSGLGTIGVLYGDGGGKLSAPSWTGTAADPTGLTVGDFTGDGLPDAAVVGSGSGILAVHFNDGYGGLPQKTSIVTPDYPLIDVVMGDVTGNSEPDLVVSSFDGWIEVWENLGGGGFAAPVRYLAGGQPTRLAIADVNGDAYRDIVTGNDIGSSVSVLPGPGFTVASVGIPYPAWDVALSDVDGDGAQDLVTSSFYNGSVTLSLGDGSGSFSTTDTWGVGGYGRDVLIRDFNSDGHRDIGAVSQNGGLYDMVRDATPPTTTIHGTSLDSWHTADVDVTFTADDPAVGSGVDAMYYDLDGGGQTAYTPPGTLTITGDGTHSIEYWSIDAVGNAEWPHQTQEVRIDTLQPTTTATGPLGWVVGPVTPTVTESDPGADPSGIYYTQYRLDGGGWQTLEPGAPPEISGAGVHTFEYRSVDVADNEQDIQTLHVRLGTPVVHVATTGDDATGTGTAANPFRTVQHGLDVCVGDAGETVQVADGTYNELVTMKSGVVLNGAGVGKTILNGNVIGDPAGDGTVVTVSGCGAGTTLSALTITNGASAGSDAGGIMATGSTLTIADCDISNNSGGSGGGVTASSGGSLTVRRSSVSGNSASTEGGGIYADTLSSMVLEDTSILGNHAASLSGGVSSWYVVNNSFDRCTVKDNSSANMIGGVALVYSTDSAVRDTVIADNADPIYGMAVYTYATSTAVISGCTIVGNSGGSYGAIYNADGPLVVRDSIVRNPTAGPELGGDPVDVAYSDIEGGYAGLGNIDADPAFVGPGSDYRLDVSSPCINTGDPGVLSGFDRDGIPRPQDGNFSGDVVADMGAYEALVFRVGPPYSGDQTIPVESAFAGATSMRFRNAPGGDWSEWEAYGGTRWWDLDISGGSGDRTVEGEFDFTGPNGPTIVVLSGTTYYDVDPPHTTDDLFTDDWYGGAVTATLVADDGVGVGVWQSQYRLDGGPWRRGTSVTIDPPADLVNDPVRTLQYRSIDLISNVEETQTTLVRFAPLVHVDQSTGSDTTGRGTLADPYATIGKGLSVCGSDHGMTVEVHAGYYVEHVAMHSGTTLSGAGGPRPIVAGEGYGPVITIDSGAPDTTVRGLTVFNGYAPGSYGGGVCVTSGSAIIDDCLVTGNYADSGGGIAAFGAAAVTIVNCDVNGNTAAWMGGGVAGEGCASLAIIDSTVADNVVSPGGNNGAGVAAWDGGAVRISRSSIVGNSGSAYIGGITFGLQTGLLAISDSVVARNVSTSSGYGSLCFYGCSMPGIVEGSTIVDNSADPYGAVYAEGSAGGTVDSSIVRNPGAELWTVSAQYSDIEEGAGGTNIGDDPLFVDPSAGDYRLASGSLCVDTGNPGLSADNDCDQVSRPQDGDGDALAVHDMGAYERPYFAIEGGAPSTSTAQVTLNVGFAGADQVRFRNGSGDWSEWGYVGPTFAWTLDPLGGAGTRVVEAEFAFAGVSGPRTVRVADDIFLDPPVDTDPPVTEQAGAYGDWNATDVNVSFMATDYPDPGASGIAYTEYSLDDGATWIRGTDVTFVAEPDHSNDRWYTVMFRSVDNAGNVEEPQSCEFGIDTTPPDMSDDAPGGWVNTDTTVTIYASDSGAGWMSTKRRIDGGPWAKSPTALVPVSLGDGIHAVEYFGLDYLANIGEPQSCEVKVDTTAPSTSDDYDGAYHAVPFSFSLLPADNPPGPPPWTTPTSGPAHTYWSIAGKSDVYEGTTVDLDPAVVGRLRDGLQTVWYWSVDGAGNVEEARSVNVQVDSSAPTTRDDSDGLLHASDVTVHFTARDGYSGWATTFYAVDGAPGWTEGSSLVIPAAANSGTHYIWYYSVDAVGNVEPTRVTWVRIQ